MSRKNKRTPKRTISPDAPKEWTVMIYLAGDNNLSEECVWAIKELYRVGLCKDIAVIAQYDSVAPGVPVTRYDLTDLPASTPSESLTPSESIQTIPRYVKGEREAFVALRKIDQATLPNHDAHEAHDALRQLDQDALLSHEAHDDKHVREFVTATALINFAKDCVTKHPAKHYLLVLSGHGSAAVGKFFLKSDSANRFLSVPMLAFAACKINEEIARVKEAKTTEDDKQEKLSDRLDIIGLDACAMSTVEVGYQLKDVADYMVGAEGFERNSGWPYHRILQALNKKPAISPNELATEIVKLYVKYYFDYAVAGVSVDQAACDLSRMDALAAAINELAAALTDNAAILDAVILAHWRAQSYILEDYVDLWDFCDLLQKSCDKTQSRVRVACDTVKKRIEPEEGAPRDGSAQKGTAVLRSCVSGADFQHSHGLSIYFPWVDISPLYSRLGFAFKQLPPGTACNQKHIPETDSDRRIQTTPWFDFIQYYVEKSRRPVRRWDDQSTDDKSTGEELIFGHPVSSLSLRPRTRRRATFSHSTSSAALVRFAGTKNDKFAGTKDDKFGADLEPKIKNPPLTFFKDPCIDEKDILTPDDNSGKKAEGNSR